MEKDRFFVTALARGLDILTTFSPQEPRLTLTAITRRTGLAKSTIVRLLHTLRETGFIEYDEARKVYFPGVRCMALGMSVLAGMDVVSIANPYLARLAERTGQLVNLGVLSGGEVVYLARFGQQQYMHLNIQVGSRLPAGITAIGKVLLAFSTEQERERALGEGGAGSGGAAPDIRLRGEVPEIRRRGVAFNDEELAPSVRAVAAPVWGRGDKLIAGVNLACSSSTTTLDDLKEKYLPHLVECAADISLSCGATEDWVRAGCRSAGAEA